MLLTFRVTFISSYTGSSGANGNVNLLLQLHRSFFAINWSATWARMWSCYSVTRCYSVTSSNSPCVAVFRPHKFWVIGLCLHAEFQCSVGLCCRLLAQQFWMTEHIVMSRRITIIHPIHGSQHQHRPARAKSFVIHPLFFFRGFTYEYYYIGLLNL